MKRLLSSQCRRNLSELLENKIQINRWPIVSVLWEQVGDQDKSDSWGVRNQAVLRKSDICLGLFVMSLQPLKCLKMRWVLTTLMHKSLWSLANGPSLACFGEKNHAYSGHNKLPVKMTSSDPGAVFHKQQLNPSEDNKAVIRVSRRNENLT